MRTFLSTVVLLTLAVVLSACSGGDTPASGDTTPIATATPTPNETRPDERARLTGRQTELTEWLEQQHERQETVGSLPRRVRSFLEDVQAMDTRRAKALLQTILSAAHVYRDGRIELEFRGQRPS